MHYNWVCGTYEDNFILDVMYLPTIDKDKYMLTIQEGNKCTTEFYNDRSTVVKRYESLLKRHKAGERILLW